MLPDSDLDLLAVVNGADDALLSGGTVFDHLVVELIRHVDDILRLHYRALELLAPRGYIGASPSSSSPSLLSNPSQTWMQVAWLPISFMMAWMAFSKAPVPRVIISSGGWLVPFCVMLVFRKSERGRATCAHVRSITRSLSAVR